MCIAQINAGVQHVGAVAHSLAAQSPTRRPLDNAFASIAFGYCDGPLASGSIAATKAQLDTGRVLLEEAHEGTVSPNGCGVAPHWLSRYRTSILLDSDNRDAKKEV